MTQYLTVGEDTQQLRGETSLRPHQALLIALGTSVALHLLATVGTRSWFVMWQQPTHVQFNAVLNLPAAVASVATNVNAAPTPRRAPSESGRKRRPGPIARQKSEATFAAPENAIAVEQADSGAVGETNAHAAGKPADDTGGQAAAMAVPVPTTAPALVTENALVSEAPAQTVEASPPTELPRRVSISYKATTSVADGVAHYVWKRDGEKYTFESTIQASGFFVNMFAGTIAQQSSGTVTAAGIEPALFIIRRGDREVETAEFQRLTGQVKLSRGSESRQISMPPNLQDTQSFLFQLAFEAPKLKTPEDRLTILVTNARGLNRYTFKKAGEATLETNRGPVETLHLVRETTELRDSYEVWLSPKQYYLPVKLKFFVDRFPAELIATNITSTP